MENHPKILLLGNYGQLGWELQRCLLPLGEVVAMDYPEIDLVNPDQLVAVMQQARPGLILNATAYTAVDRAEQEPDKARAVNAMAPGILAEQATLLGAALIHFSTDYVFDGKKGSVYVETDPPHPLNVYGQSKLEGEQAIQQVGGAFLILRTSWVYSLRRESFVTKVLQWARMHPKLKLVDDQVSGPTWARVLAEITALLLARAGNSPVDWIRERQGLYHLAGDGYASRYEWGKVILQYDPHPEEQVVEQVLTASSDEFPTPAQRPLFSAMNCDKFRQTFGLSLPTWQDALRLAMLT